MFIVGFDLGKRKSQLCVQDLDGNVLAELRVDTGRDEIVEALMPFRGAQVLVEASTSAEWVARLLESNSFSVVVADPRFSLMYAQRDKKVKTDRRDARALAEALRLRAYRPAHRKSDVARRLQGRLVVRRQLVAMRTKLVTLVRSMCEREGVMLPRCHVEMFTRVLEGQQLDPVVFDIIGPAVQQVIELTAALDAIDDEFKALADAHPAAKLLQSVRGVGPVTSLAFVSVVDDPSRFKSARELTAYLGLVPGEHSSGDTKSRPGAITKSGDALLRGYLYEAAVTMAKRTAPDSHLKQWFTKLTLRSNGAGTKRKARVALARRLARIMFAMWRDNASYNPSRTAPIVGPPAASPAGSTAQAA